MYRHALLVAVVVAFSACDLAGPAGDLTADDAAEISSILIQDGLSSTADTTVSAGLTADGLSLDLISVSGEFTRTRECPLGGQVVTTGTRERTRDTETHTGILDVSATRNYEACAHSFNDSTSVLTLDGELFMTAHREWQRGRWNGTQEISISGLVDYDIDGEAGSCEVDITATIEAGSRERFVEGSACAHDLGLLRGWFFGFGGHGPGQGNQHGGPGPHGSGHAGPGPHGDGTGPGA